MLNRRQVLQLGLTAAILPGLASAGQRSSIWAAAAELAHSPLYKAIYDASYARAREFAERMRTQGVAVHPIDGDVTSVWYHDLELRWRASPVAIAGLTAPEALFCLEQLAWDHRMRVVSRATVEHSPHSLVLWLIAPVVRP